MKRLLIMIAATLGLAACGETFTAAEREVIHSGGHGIMRVLSIDNEADSLALREESRPMSESLLRTEEYALLREHILSHFHAFSIFEKFRFFVSHSNKVNFFIPLWKTRSRDRLTPCQNVVVICGLSYPFFWTLLYFLRSVEK